MFVAAFVVAVVVVIIILLLVFLHIYCVYFYLFCMHTYELADGKRAKPVASLVRPLPWILFLPTLVALRYARVLFSLISICCGCDEIEPSTMVSYLHQTRRTLRHIAHDAKQQQAIDKQNQATSIDYNKRLSGIVSFLSELIGTILSDKVHTNNKTSVIICDYHETNKSEMYRISLLSVCVN